MGGTFIQSYSWCLFFEPQVLLFLDLRGVARLIVFPEIAAIVGKAKAGERQGQNETEKAE